MPTSAEEIKVLESYAKFEALQELIEDDFDEENPSQAEYSNISENHLAF